MCECGCGELRPIAKFPAPDGKWYAVEFYPGCTNCRNDHAAIGITLLDPADEFDRFTLEGVKEAEFNKYAQWGRIVLRHDVMREEARKENGPDEFSEANFAFDEFLSRGGLINAFYATQQKELERA